MPNFEHTRNRTPNHCLYRPNNKCWDNVRRSTAPSRHLWHHRCSHFENQIRYTAKIDSLFTCLDCIGHSNGLSRNSVRAYVLGTAKQIGDLTAIRIWHDCRGRSPDWFLHRITVENLATGEVYFFLCDKVSQSLWKFDLWRNRGVLCRGKLRPHTDVERDLSTD